MTGDGRRIRSPGQLVSDRGTLLLDSEGLYKLYLKDRTVLTLVQGATEEGIRVAATAVTTLEADYERIHPARIRWILSRIEGPVTVLTSDTEDISLLGGPAIEVTKV